MKFERLFIEKQLHEVKKKEREFQDEIQRLDNQINDFKTKRQRLENQDQRELFEKDEEERRKAQNQQYSDIRKVQQYPTGWNNSGH